MKRPGYFFRILLLCTSLSLFQLSFALEKIQQGASLNPFSLEGTDGKIYTLDDFTGSPLLLAYIRPDQKKSLALLKDCEKWASEMPSLQIVLITCDTLTPEQQAAFKFPVLSDPEKKVYEDWGVRVFPTIIVLDEQGKVVRTKVGYGLGGAKDLKGDLEFVTGKKTREEVEKERRGFKSGDFAQGNAVQLYHAGKKLWDDGFVERARTEWEGSVREDSTFVPPRLALARYFLRTGEIEEAEKHIKTVLKLEPSVEALILNARCLILQNRLDEAEESLEKALDMNRRSVDAKLTLAEVYLLENDLSEAKDMVEEVMVLNKDLPRGYYLLGRIAEAEGDLPAAIVNYRTALNSLLEQ